MRNGILAVLLVACACGGEEGVVPVATSVRAELIKMQELAANSQAAKASDEKVTICHIPPGNPENRQEIRVSASAVRAHLAHGDYLGPCAGQCSVSGNPCSEDVACCEGLACKPDEASPTGFACSTAG